MQRRNDGLVLAAGFFTDDASRADVRPHYSLPAGHFVAADTRDAPHAIPDPEVTEELARRPLACEPKTVAWDFTGKNYVSSALSRRARSPSTYLTQRGIGSPPTRPSRMMVFRADSESLRNCCSPALPPINMTASNTNGGGAPSFSSDGC
jgi:hypothetical protein